MGRWRDRIEWTRVIGVGFVLIALRAAADPDYPVARESRPQPDAAPVRRPAPQVIGPRGEVEAAPLEFAWSGPGAPRRWRVHVFDAELADVVVGTETSATTWKPDAAFLGKLPSGVALLWQVRAIDDAECRSSPALFVLR